MAGRKANNANLLSRVEEVKILLLRGATRTEILKAMAKHGLCDRQIDSYVARANEEIEEKIKDGSSTLLAKLLSNQWSLYSKAYEDGNLKIARQILMDIAKLRGLDVQRVIHDHRELEGEDPEVINDLARVVAEADAVH